MEEESEKICENCGLDKESCTCDEDDDYILDDEELDKDDGLN